MSMLWRFPYSVVSGKILRASIFFCSYKVLSILQGSEAVDDNTKINAQNKNIDKVVRDIGRRSWRHRQPLETVAMHIIPGTNESTAEPTTFIRANNVSAYLEANRYMMRLQAKKLGHQQHPPVVKGQATIGNDSLVGDNSEISERTSIKRTIIGNNCKVGKRCRINGCVVLDGVVIEDDVVLENCVIGKESIIHSKARLTSCNVEGKYEVRSQLQTKNELLQNLTMESLQDGAHSDDEPDTAAANLASASESDGESGSDSNSQWEVSEGEDVSDDDDGLFDRS